MLGTADRSDLRSGLLGREARVRAWCHRRMPIPSRTERSHVYDLQNTLPRLLECSSEHFASWFAGRDLRFTNVRGQVAQNRVDRSPLHGAGLEVGGHHARCNLYRQRTVHDGSGPWGRSPSRTSIAPESHRLA